MSKIIVIIPVKNDAWFVKNTIDHARYWADEIIIDDDSSDDGSQEIFAHYANFSNVHHIIRPKGQSFIGPERRNYMLSLARNFNGNNLIFEIHADEILSAEILKPEIRNKLIEDMPVGSALMTPWVNMWKNPFYYRNDKSVWSNNKSWFAYRDDREVRFEGSVFHGPRSPESFTNKKVEIDYLQVMHYQFVNLAMERSKQALYQIFEKNHYPNKNTEYINKLYACAFDERNINLARIDEKHIRPWIEKGIAINQEFPKDGYNWRDTEILKNFRKYGLEKYKDLNIWYIDWEAKRREAMQLNINENIPNEVISDPRDLSTRLAHKFLMKYQKYPFWRLNFFLLIFQKVIEKLRRKVYENKWF